ncbi:Uncharacterized protein FKW44_019357, partial [Caligus rogercresseyi]
MTTLSLSVKMKTEKGNEPQNLSFAGCGFLGIYHVGVSAAMRQYAPHLIFDKISGASQGPWPPSVSSRALPCGTWQTKSSQPALCAAHTSNVHELVNGRLHISVTRVYDGKNVIISNFVSKKELIEVRAVVASSFIPIFSGIMPYRYRGIRVIDGGFSVNAPKLDDGTITVSPFRETSPFVPRTLSSPQQWRANNCDDIQRYHMLLRVTNREEEEAYNEKKGDYDLPPTLLFFLYFTEIGHNISIENINRIVRVLYPPPPGVLAELCSEGFRDAIAYLQKHNLISCNRCLCTISSIYSKNNSELMQKSEDLRKNEMEASPHKHDSAFEGDCQQCQDEIE